MVFHVSCLAYAFYQLFHRQEIEEASCDHLFQLLVVAGKQNLLFPVDATADRRPMFRGPNKKMVEY